MAKREAEELKRQQEQTAVQKLKNSPRRKPRGSHHGGTERGRWAEEKRLAPKRAAITI